MGPTPLFKKLNFKNHHEVIIFHSPESFRPEVECMKAISSVQLNPVELHQMEFVLCFVTKQSQIEEISSSVLPLLNDDAVLWFAYPKGSSKKYRCNINRDHGWDILGSYGYEPVRQVAIDEDWSALRFRHIHNIRRFNRNEKMVLSDEGKARVQGRDN